MNNIQKEKFKKLIIELDESNKYYSNIIRKNKIENYELKLFPIITKSEIKSNYADYISTSKEKPLLELTSGSSGVPLKCWKTKTERVTAAISLWKQRKRRDPYVNNQNFLPLVGYNTYHKIGDFCNFDKENIKECFDGLLEFNPRWISGPITIVERYAKEIEKGNISYSGGIKFIELAGEFADIKQRKFIEKVFGADTINQYGSRECWCIAYECQDGHLHTLDDIYVEINREKELLNGYGEIIVTSLFNYVMPIIRYNTDDLGKLIYKKCSCENPNPILELAGGRTGDVIKGSKEVLGDIFFKRILCKMVDYVESFKVEQTDEGHFNIYIVKTNEYDDFVTTKIHKKIEDDLGKRVRTTFKFVDNIPLSASGKQKLFSSY